MSVSENHDARPTPVSDVRDFKVTFQTLWTLDAEPELSPPVQLAPGPAKVVSMKMSAPAVRCHRYNFVTDDSVAFKSPAAGTDGGRTKGGQCDQAERPPATAAVPSQGTDASRSSTRIRPPRDVVKLQDRLFYVLQPSLETLLSSDSLDLPHQPFPYQFEGISFLYPRQAAVLADEMGLGKTMQCITAIRLLIHLNEIRSVLLVCPKPLITNWQRELSLWAPELPTSVISGDAQRRRWAWQRDEVPIKIVNYESVLRDAELVDGGEIAADLVVLDEAQRIKNSASSTNQTICRIPRRRSWALTGTPIENSTADLVGIFEFLASGLVSHGMAPRRLARATCDYILRRTKEKVLTDLPPKLFRDATLELSPEQFTSYDMAENEGVVRLNAMEQGLTIQHVFELVLRLKQICNFDPATGASSKLERLNADLEEVAASGHKAIVFSQWVDTLERLALELERFHPLQYHGRISSSQRENAIRDFRESPDHTVLLLSYGAGSVGLNLQFCSYVFLYDRWWNPAVEDQAINRAHRIGSAGPVTITRFITPGTIEQRIDDILRQKRELMSEILDHQDVPSQIGLSRQEIFGLFGLKDAA